MIVSMDAGQIVISIFLFLLTIVSYFIKKEIMTFGKRIDKHDDMLLDLTGSVKLLLGRYQALVESGKTE